MGTVIRPSVLQALSSGQPVVYQTEYHDNCQRQPDPQLTWWGRFKAKAKKFLGKIKNALDYTKEVIVPIINTATAVYNLINGKDKSQRSNVCAA